MVHPERLVRGSHSRFWILMTFEELNVFYQRFLAWIDSNMGRFWTFERCGKARYWTEEIDLCDCQCRNLKQQLFHVWDVFFSRKIDYISTCRYAYCPKIVCYDMEKKFQSYIIIKEHTEHYREQYKGKILFIYFRYRNKKNGFYSILPYSILS